MRTAVIYARVSSTSDRQSTDRQVADLRNYAAKEGIRVIRVYKEHLSGTLEDRPELLACIEFCKEHKHELLVSEVSRLGRSVKIIVNTADELTNGGVNIHILNLHLQTLGQDGKENAVAKLMLTVLGLGAEIERKAIVSRLNSGRELAKVKGVKMGRPKGSKMTDEQILDKYPEAARRLRNGLSVRDTAKLCDVSPSTVQRVKKIIDK